MKFRLMAGFSAILMLTGCPTGGKSGSGKEHAPVTLSAINVTSLTSSGSPGEAFHVEAEAVYSDGSRTPAEADWTASNAGGVSAILFGTHGTSADGALTATGTFSGSVTLTATYQGKSGQTAIQVIVELTSLSVVPLDFTLDPGATKQVTCMGHYTSGITVPVAATWIPNAYVSVSGSPGTTVTLTALVTGNAIVGVSFGGQTTELHFVVNVVLNSIRVTSSITLDPGQSVTLEARGIYSNNTQPLVAATWASSNADVTLSSNAGPSIQATAVTPGGSTTVTATFEGKVATCTITITDPGVPVEGPGPVYGCSTGIGMLTGGLVKIGSAGQAVSGVCIGGPPFMLDGIAMDHARTTAYGMQNAAGGATLAKVNVAAGTAVQVATFPVENNGYVGIDVDSQGRVYTAGWHSGLVYRFDPTQPAGPANPSIVGSGAGGNFALIVGPGDDLYYGNSWARFGATPWIFKHVLSTNTVTPWAFVPPALAAKNNGNAFMGGLACNAAGEIFVCDYYNPDVYKFVDLNHDGDAADDGECVLIGSLPYIAPVDGMQFNGQVMGIGATQDGGVVVNVMECEGNANTGVWWIPAPGQAAVQFSTDNFWPLAPNQLYCPR